MVKKLPNNFEVSDEYKSLLETILDVFPDKFVNHISEFKLTLPDFGKRLGDGMIYYEEKKIRIGYCPFPMYGTELILHEFSHLLEDCLEKDKEYVDVLSDLKEYCKANLNSLQSSGDKNFDLFLFHEVMRHNLTDSLPIYILYPEVMDKLSLKFSFWKKLKDVYDKILNLDEDKREKIYSETKRLCDSKEYPSKLWFINQEYKAETRGYVVQTNHFVQPFKELIYKKWNEKGVAPKVF